MSLLRRVRAVEDAGPYEFYRRCGVFRPLPEGAGFCEAKDWGSVVLKEYTPSVFAYGEASRLRATPAAALTVPRTVIHSRDDASLTLREGGDFIAALRRCHFALQNDREGQASPLLGGSIFRPLSMRNERTPGDGCPYDVYWGTVGISTKNTHSFTPVRVFAYLTE